MSFAEKLRAAMGHGALLLPDPTIRGLDNSIVDNRAIGSDGCLYRAIRTAPAQPVGPHSAGIFFWSICHDQIYGRRLGQHRRE